MLSRINANLPCYQCTSSHDDLYVLHNHLSCHPGWVKLYFGWVKSFTIIHHCVCVFYHHIPLCMWLIQVISKWACRNMPRKVQVEHWVFRNKPFAIVALWWLKNSWNRCALFFNISVWFGTFEGEIISEWNLVLKKSLRIQGFFPSCQQTWLGSGEVVSNWITSDCLLGGLFTHLFLLWNSTYKPHEFRILFTSLWKRPQPLPVWGWEFF